MVSHRISRASRISIDSSIIIAASISAIGDSRALLLAAIHARLRLFWSDLVIEEIERNLTRKAPRALPAYQALRDIVPFTIVNPPEQLVQDVATVVAVKDAPIVAAALYAQTSFLVSLDRKHLLNQAELIADRFGLAVVPPIRVLMLLREEEPDDN